MVHTSRLVLVAPALAALLASAPALRAERPRSIPEKEERVDEGIEPAPPELDRSTPARAWSALVRSCREARPQLGMYVLNLGDVPEADRKTLGPLLFQQLCDVLKTTRRLDAAGLDDSALGPLVDGQPSNYIVVHSINLPTGNEEVWLRRIHDLGSQRHLWLLTRQTVSAIPTWYRTLISRDVVTRPALETLDSGLPARIAKLAPETPREAAVRFSALCRRGDFDQAAALLDLSSVEPAKQAKEGPRLARRLYLMLKRLRPGGGTSLSNDPAGAPERDAAVDEEVVARTKIADREVLLKLVRYPRAVGRPVWLFGTDTVASLDDIYPVVGYGLAGDLLPAFFFEWEALNVQLWQWLGMLVALFLSLVSGKIAATVTKAVLARLASRTRWAWDDQIVKVMGGPLTAVYAVLAFLLIANPLALAEGPYDVVLEVAKLVAILAAGWFLLCLVDVAGEALAGHFKGRDDDMATAMVPVFRKVIKPMSAALVAVVALQNMGMNVAGLLAGLGIGGLAIALAGKSTLENLFGSLAIAIDRPFKIGEFVKVGEFMGVIEDLGLRSTRIRTLDRTLVSIPNGQMADAKVENFARRDRFRVSATLGVEYGTSIEQVKLIVDDLKKHLLTHPDVWQEGFTVRFTGFGAFSLNVEVTCWVQALNWDIFTGIREELFFEMGRIVERAGARFAFPSQTLYQAQAEPADPKRAEAARVEIERRDKAGELCLPEIPASVREAAKKGLGRAS